MKTCILDIETIPDIQAAQRAGVDLSHGCPSWPLHQIACVSILSVDSYLGSEFQFKIETFSRAELGERGIVASVENVLQNSFEVVTWNGRGFDLPVLMLRAAVARERCPRILKLMGQSRLCPGAHIDLLEQVSRYGSAPRVKLAEFCSAFAIPVKIEAHGDDVAALVQCGKWETVARYCETDVVATWLALQGWRSVERDDPELLDRSWSNLASWIDVNQPILGHLKPYAEMDFARGGRALSNQHVDLIKF